MNHTTHLDGDDVLYAPRTRETILRAVCGEEVQPRELDDELTLVDCGACLTIAAADPKQYDVRDYPTAAELADEAGVSERLMVVILAADFINRRARSVEKDGTRFVWVLSAGEREETIRAAREGQEETSGRP